MNHKIILQRICSCFLLNLILFLQACFGIDDPNYTACVPKSCGGAGINISYPFFIKDQQEPTCGFPGFDVSCDAKNETIIGLFGANYTIKNIYYNNQTIRVVDSKYANFSGNDNCSVPFQNLTLRGDRFKFSLNHMKLFILSSCNSSFWEFLDVYKVNGCLGRNESDPVFAILEEEYSNVTGNIAGKCKKVVEVPVELGGDAVENRTLAGEKWWEYYEEEVFERGFLLQWIATDCGVCADSGGRCGFDSKQYQFMCFCTDRPHFDHCHRTNKPQLALVLGLGLCTISVIGILSLFLWCLCKKKYGPIMFARNLSRLSKSASYQERGSVCYGVPIFSYCELEEATNNFDSKKELGDGGFGTVYHGILRDGREVAVKRLHESNYKRVEQFMNEIKIITCLRHKNLVTLYGCTSRHSRELLLVYEFIPNGTVADHLNGDLATTTLKWPVRMSIAIETATALAYLHRSDIIHRDVKTSNILLDSNFCVKVADFGLSRLFPLDVTHVSTAPQGTPGYVDPEYHQCYQLTDKSDVYSFGVVLIELISSLPAVDISRHRHEINLANLAINKITNHAYNDLIDPFLGFDTDSIVEKSIIAVAELAFRCLQSDKEMRPTMDEVLENLKGIEQRGGSESSKDKDLTEEEVEMVVSGEIIRPQPSPDNEEVGLLGKMRPPFSPIAVTDRAVQKPTEPINKPNNRDFFDRIIEYRHNRVPKNRIPTKPSKSIPKPTEPGYRNKYRITDNYCYYII